MQRLWLVSAGLLVLAVALLLAVPGLRDVWDMKTDAAHRWYPSTAEVDAVLQRHPGDREMLFAAALQAQEDLRRLGWAYRKPKPSAAEVAAARARAVSMRQAALQAAPDWPVPWFFLGLSLLDVAYLPSPDPGDYANPRWRPVPTTAEKRAAVHEAIRLLTRAATLDPGNARVRYVLAALHFAERDDTAAWRQLAAAEQAPQWDDYQKATAPALRRFYREIPLTRPWADMLAGTEVDWPLIGSRVRALGRLLSLQADLKRQSGDHAGALKAYRSVLLLGYRMRHDARDAMDAIVAGAITPMATGRFLSQEERDRLRREGGDDWLTRQRHAEAEAFARYASAHGDAALGQFAIRETEAVADFRPRLTAAFDRQSNSPLTRLGEFLGRAVPILPWQLAPLALWLVISTLSAGVARLRRRQPTPTVPRPLALGLLLLALVVANIALAAWYRSGEWQANGNGDWSHCPSWKSILLAAVDSGSALGAAMAFVAYAAARRPHGVGRGMEAVATAGLYAFPVICAAVLCGVLMLLVIWASYMHQGHVCMQQALVGQLQYLGVTPR